MRSQPEPDRLENNVQVLNRALRVLSACTQAVIRSTDELALLQTVCQQLVEVGEYHLAWIGYAQQDPEKSVKPLAYSGQNADYLATIQVTWSDTEHGQGPTGRAIRSGTACVAQNMLTDPSYLPWRESALARGYQSSAAIPLKENNTVFGTLNLYSTQSEAFNPEELELLTELADSLSFGILTLRTEQERQRAEQALRLSEEKFAKAFYSSPLAKSIISLEQGRYIDVNYSFEWLFGHARDEILGKTALEIGLWESSNDRTRMLQALEKQGSLKNYETYLRNCQGERILCRISAELIQIEDQICTLSIIENITERKQAENTILQLNQELESRVAQRTDELLQATERLESLNQELQRSNQELEQFAYVASHDLQEPLRAVTGYTQLLIGEYGDRFDETALSYAEFITDGAKRMQQLIQDLLAYSRVGTRGKAFSQTDCQLVLQQVLRNLQITIAEAQAVIKIGALPSNLPADQNQLGQIFQNLISNAIKFQREQPTVVEISATQQEKQWLFQVKDNGIGIKPQYLDRIFEVFKRLHTRREYPGTGIGLAICKKIVLRHGGQIWAESTPGVGTTFCFTIPFEQSL